MPGHRFYELDWISAIDIDNKEDFLMAKVCLEFRNKYKIQKIILKVKKNLSSQI